MVRNVRTFVGVIALAASAIAPRAHAEVTYTYTGTPFTGAFVNEWSPPQPTPMQISMKLTFDDALADGAYSLSELPPKAWELEVGNIYSVLGPSLVGALTGTWTIFDGKVTDWAITVNSSFPGPHDGWVSVVALTRDAESVQMDMRFINDGQMVDLGSYSGLNLAVRSSDPWVAVVPEPSTFSMTFIGLMLIGAMARRRA